MAEQFRDPRNNTNVNLDPEGGEGLNEDAVELLAIYHRSTFGWRVAKRRRGTRQANDYHFHVILPEGEDAYFLERLEPRPTPESPACTITMNASPTQQNRWDVSMVVQEYEPEAEGLESS